jgi:hypothetical protein
MGVEVASRFSLSSQSTHGVQASDGEESTSLAWSRNEIDGNADEVVSTEGRTGTSSKTNSGKTREGTSKEWVQQSEQIRRSIKQNFDCNPASGE